MVEIILDYTAWVELVAKLTRGGKGFEVQGPLCRHNSASCVLIQTLGPTKNAPALLFLNAGPAITLSNAIWTGRVLPGQPDALMGLASASAAGIRITSVGEWVPNHTPKGSAEQANAALCGHSGGTKGYTLGSP